MRDVNSLPGLHKLRTMFSARKRSMPKVQGSAYLDLYMLNKEKERLIKEDERLCMRQDVVKTRLGEIDLETNRLQKVETAAKTSGDTSSSEGIITEKQGLKKEWKTMSLNY